jgi:hypothetical protein
MSKYKNMLCRGCGINIETQGHVLSTCPKLHKDNSTKVYVTDIVNKNNPDKLVAIAENIEKTMTKLNAINQKCVVPSETNIT